MNNKESIPVVTLARQLFEKTNSLVIICNYDATVVWANTFAMSDGQKLPAPITDFIADADPSFIKYKINENKSFSFLSQVQLDTPVVADVTPLEGELFLIKTNGESSCGSNNIKKIIEDYSLSQKMRFNNTIRLIDMIIDNLGMIDYYPEVEVAKNIRGNFYKLFRDSLNRIEFLRLHNGVKELTFQTLDMANFLQILFEYLKMHSLKEGIGFFNYKRNFSNTQCRIDMTTFTSAILNIIHNAAIYSGSGQEIDIEASVKRNMFILSVKNYGFGIDRNNQDDIWKPYYSYNPDSNRFPGQGLGLAITKKVIEELHGGRCDFYSQPNKNDYTIFTIAIPCREYTTTETGTLGFSSDSSGEEWVHYLLHPLMPPAVLFGSMRKDEDGR
ncbi:MAG: ATP-binding protein [Oscillospiraceae bacterium]|nr:ATP-binding protein [Oscillospiraceae bacterium]